jgi:hypothetical protein
VLTGQFADWDGDGRPDHVMGQDGFWHAFNPRTGQMADGTSLSATLTGGQSPPGAAPTGLTQSALPTPAPNQPLAPVSPPALLAPPQQPLMSTGAPESIFGARPMQAPPLRPQGVSQMEASGPAYQTGIRHPFFGGDQPTPGGGFNPGGPSSGGTQITNFDTGASAGPGNVRSPRSALASSPLYTRGATSGSAPQRDGSHRSPLYDKFRAKGDAMEAKVRGKASAIQGKVSGMGSGSSMSAAPSRGMSSGFSSGGSSFAEPKVIEPKMKGLAKGMDPQQAEALFTRPTMLLPKIAKGVDPASPLYDIVSGLPASQLAMLGTSNKKSTERNSISQMVNATGKVYNRALEGNLPSFDQMVKDLTSAKSKSALGQAMVPPRPERTISGYARDGKPRYSREEPDYFTPPLSTAANTMSSLIRAIGQTAGLDERVINAYSEMGDYMIDKFGGSQLKKAPSKMKPMNRKVGRKLFNDA